MTDPLAEVIADNVCCGKCVEDTVPLVKAHITAVLADAEEIAKGDDYAHGETTGALSIIDSIRASLLGTTGEQQRG